MTLDPLLWKIIGAKGNETEPLSFRKWGTFTCEAPTLAETIVECGAPEQMASDFVRFAISERLSALRELSSRPFSGVVAEKTDQDPFGMLSTTKVLSLLDEGKYEDVRSFLNGKYEKGVSINVVRPDAEGHARSIGFFDLARDYALSAKEPMMVETD